MTSAEGATTAPTAPSGGTQQAPAPQAAPQPGAAGAGAAAQQADPVGGLSGLITAAGAAADVPVIELSGFLDGSDRAGVVHQVGRACEEIGFLVVSGHGVPAATIEAAVAASLDFFHLPEADKRRTLPEHDWFFRGFEPLGGSALARSLGRETPPDLCELFRISRFDEPAAAEAAIARAGGAPELDPVTRTYFFGPNIWPDQPAALRPALTAYYRELERLAATLMRVFALALDLPETWFDPFIDHHITDLAVNWYPPQPEPPQPGQLRRGAHSDYGSMTILHQSDAPGGLQVLTKAGTWADVPHVPGTFVVNLGDLMARWTNDRWVSTMHRVVNPTRADATAERVSIPFFHQPNYDAVIECLPGCSSPDDPPHHEPVTSGHWVLTKTRMQVGY